jgi:D-glycero-D-manno-heptose 1,7-bisphosphate phosphatase
MRAAAFLDRDGVINADYGYIYRPEDFDLLPGVPDALRRLKAAGYMLIIVTNQSGIGRGYYSETDVSVLHRHLHSTLAREGAALDAIYLCPHRPDEGCDCRKPKPGLILRAVRDLAIDTARSFIVGDKSSDIAAGAAAGLGAGYLISTEVGGLDSLGRCVEAHLEATGSGACDSAERHPTNRSFGGA